MGGQWQRSQFNGRWALCESHAILSSAHVSEAASRCTAHCLGQFGVAFAQWPPLCALAVPTQAELLITHVVAHWQRLLSQVYGARWRAAPNGNRTGHTPVRWTLAAATVATGNGSQASGYLEPSSRVHSALCPHASHIGSFGSVNNRATSNSRDSSKPLPKRIKQLYSECWFNVILNIYICTLIRKCCVLS